MREYSTPAVVDVPASARLTDTVFGRAEQDPGLVVLRRKASLAPSRTGPGDREAAWQNVTARQFPERGCGTVFGFSTGVLDLGQVLGPLLGASLVALLPPVFAFGLIGALLGTAAVLAAASRPRAGVGRPVENSGKVLR